MVELDGKKELIKKAMIQKAESIENAMVESDGKAELIKNAMVEEQVKT